MGGEDKLGSSASFSVSLVRSFRSSPGFEIGLGGFFFSKLASIKFLPFLADANMVHKAIAPRKWQGDFPAVKAEVVLAVAPSYPQG